MSDNLGNENKSSFMHEKRKNKKKQLKKKKYAVLGETNYVNSDYSFSTSSSSSFFSATCVSSTHSSSSLLSVDAQKKEKEKDKGRNETREKNGNKERERERESKREREEEGEREREKTKKNKKNKTKIFIIEEENKQKSKLHNEKNKSEVEYIFDKIRKKKKKKIKKQLPLDGIPLSIQEASNSTEYNESVDCQQPRTISYFINKINRELKRDSESIYVENRNVENIVNDVRQSKQRNQKNQRTKNATVSINDTYFSTKRNIELEEAVTYTGTVQELNIVDSKHQNAIQNGSQNDESQNDGSQNENKNENEDTDGERNLFTRFFHRIKKKIIERKGNPITNENAEEHPVSPNDNVDEMYELQNMNNATNANTNINTRNMGEQNEIYRNNELMYNQSTVCVTSSKRNETEYSNRDRDRREAEEIISLNGLNPNDVFDNRIIENRETEITILNSNNVYDTNESNEESRFRRLYPRAIVTNIKMRVDNIKEKIKKYWADRVAEANIQMNMPHQNTTRSTTTTTTTTTATTNATVTNGENTHSTDDANDDPSCLQILFFFGLIYKFPVLWIIGAVIFCITPSEHKKTKKWSLINSIFAFFSIVYFIITAKIKSNSAGFTVFMNEKAEPHLSFHKGIIKHNNVVRNFIALDKSIDMDWICKDKEKTFCKTGRKNFLEWSFIQAHKPTRNILLSKDVYNFLNRIQVTVFFGKGNSYKTEKAKRISRLLENVKIDMGPILYENLTMTDKEIPHDFFGCGLRCVRADAMEKEKWFLFWKEENEETFSSGPVPVGDVFFFKNEHNCKVAFIYPNTIHVDQKHFPNNFVEVTRIIIKSF